jgi:hypothetical protein
MGGTDSWSGLCGIGVSGRYDDCGLRDRRAVNQLLETAIGDDIAGLEAGCNDRVAFVGNSRLHGCHDGLADRLIAPAVSAAAAFAAATTTAATASATSVVTAALATR